MKNSRVLGVRKRQSTWGLRIELKMLIVGTASAIIKPFNIGLSPFPDFYSTDIIYSQHTRCLVIPEVDVGQNKVDDSWTIFLDIRILGFKDIAFLQSFSIKHIRINLWKGELVHSGPLFCK